MLKNVGAFQGQPGVELRTPLLADAGPAAPGSARGQIALLNEQDIGQPPLGQLERHGASDNTAADDNGLIIFLHSAPPSRQASARTPMLTGFVGGRKVGMRTSSIGTL